jgi:hypothetical protein
MRWEGEGEEVGEQEAVRTSLTYRALAQRMQTRKVAVISGARQRPRPAGLVQV